MWPFDEIQREMAGPPALQKRNKQDSATKIAELEMRVSELEAAILVLCDNLRYHFERIDNNTIDLANTINKVVSQTIRPPKDLLGGGSETN